MYAIRSYYERLDELAAEMRRIAREDPVRAIVNSFTQFVPGHVHLKDLGQLVEREVEKAGA